MKNLMKMFKSKVNMAPEVTTIPDAKKALELTKDPQMKQCIEEINDAIARGRTWTFIGDQEKLHKETREYLIGLGYDVRVKCYKEKPGDICRDRTEYFNEVSWHEGTTGKYTYSEK